MGYAALLQLAKDNLGKIFGILGIVTVLSVTYFKWEHSICERCTLAEQETWQQRDAETQAKSNTLWQKKLDEKDAELTKQHEVNIGVLKHYANKIQTLNDDNVRLSTQRMFVNVKKPAGTNCDRGSSGGVSQISTGVDRQGENVTRQELDSVTTERIRGYISDLRQEEIVLDSMIEFIEGNNLVDKSGTN